MTVIGRSGIEALLKAETRNLVGFLLMLTGNRQATDDLFQETCLEVWRNRSKFQGGTDFGAWARAIARFQVLRYWRKHHRERLTPFSPELMERMADGWTVQSGEDPGDSRLKKLRSCLDELDPEQRRLLKQRYDERLPHKQIAQEAGRGEDAVKMLLSRLRQKLHDCVEKKMGGPGPDAKEEVSMDRQEWQSLISDYLDGTITDEGRIKLARLLEENPEALSMFTREARGYLDLSVALGRELPKVPDLKSVHTRQMFRWFALAASLLIGLGVVLFLNIPDDGSKAFQKKIFRGTVKELRAPESAETIVHLTADRDLMASAGSQVILGATIDFITPTVFSFADGLDQDGRRVLTLKSGHVRIGVPSGMTGLTVRTPVGTLRNVGTVFQVQLNDPMPEETMLKQLASGKFRPQVSVQTLQGRVEFQPAAGGARPTTITQEMGKVALSVDSSLGKVSDREGLASIKPVMHDRWTVAEEGMRLEPGDWVRTGVRGANAVKLRMANDVQLILGPGALLELVDLVHLKLTQGELSIVVPEGVTLTVAGPGKKSQKVSEARVLRAHGEALTLLKEEPRWLVGYKNQTPTEAMGSLLAMVDGRNVPLTIGYHKVTVDIRDQIARTEVEESFVNTTDQVQEGVFFFPLPQDASISGFGMWVGNELVQGEIVEKERAREIYEIILREKRDPGLLEWSGGNIFKARVYPISGEKRIKISYTQVLPKVGGAYRYSYALQSELLRLHPLKQLQIDVKLNSAEPLAGVECPSHSARIDSTEHAAHVEFDAQEYVPSKDFELQVRTKSREDRTTFVSHQRGNDGYFMLLVDAPQAKGGSDRPVMPRSKPLDVMIVADTSGSMSGPQRKAQVAFVEALLSSLGDQDTINLATGDVESRWASEQRMSNTPESRERALRFLEKRFPLGWSNLDKVFASALERVGPETHMVYVGDGIITTGDADPVAFSKRLAQMYRGRGTFHAVAPGNTYETMVLRSLAGLGGGSMRVITDTEDPAHTAGQLLREISSPSIKNLKVSFDGLTVAAVYPEAMPNLMAGTQQIILGRYNPTAGQAKGKVTVSGILDGKKIEYTSDVALSGSAGEGNSYIPRLWARSHLDHLLAQGTSPEIKEKIITLSEDFQIITPYTSFLVLESDEDRERFGIKKRFRMRDAEEFFTEGRDQATYELVRKQMLKAEQWRKRLRAQILETLSGMRHDLTMALLTDRLRSMSPDEYNVSDGYIIGPGGGMGGRFGGKENSRDREDKPLKDESSDEEYQKRRSNSGEWEEQAGEPLDYEIKESDHNEAASESEFPMKQRFEMDNAKPRESPYASEEWVGDREVLRKGFLSSGKILDNKDYLGRFARASSGKSLFGDVFPSIADPRRRDPEWSGKKEIADLVQSLNRRNVIAGLEGGLHMTLSYEHKDHRGRVGHAGAQEFMAGRDAWLNSTSHRAGDDYSIEWLSGTERGVLSMAWLSCRTRDKKDGDERSWPEPYAWYFNDTLGYYRTYHVELKKLDGDRVELDFTRSDNSWALHLMIDRARSAVIEVRHVQNGRTVSTTKFSDFVQAGGAWWPQQMVVRDEEGAIATTRMTVSSMSKADLAEKIETVLAVRKDAIILGKSPEKIEEARQAVKDGKAKLEDHWFLLNWYGVTQEWDQAEPHVKALLAMGAGKRGVSALELAVLRARRRNEEYKKLSMKTAADLAGASRDADLGTAEWLLNHARTLNQGNEMSDLLTALRPVYERQKGILHPLRTWDDRMLQSLYAMNRTQEAWAKVKAMAEQYPLDAGSHAIYAEVQAQQGQIDASVKYLFDVEKKNAPWRKEDIHRLRSQACSILFNHHRLSELVDLLASWMSSEPEKVAPQLWTQYLSALVMLDREDKADQVIEQWLKQIRKEKLDAPDRNRLSAVIQHILDGGYSYNLYRSHVEPREANLLAETARYFLDHPEGEHAARILQHWKFVQTDEGRGLQKELYRRVRSESGTLPARKLQRFITWMNYQNYRGDDGEEGWKKIMETVFSRWENAEEKQDRSLLGGLLEGYAPKEIKQKFYRASLKRAETKEDRSYAVQNLFKTMLEEKWSEAVQEELVSLISQFDVLTDGGRSYRNDDDPDVALEAKILAAYRFTTWLTNAKTEAIVSAIPDVNSMPRLKLKEARTKALREARTLAIALCVRLEKSFEPEAVRPWFTMERMYHQIKLKGELDKMREEGMRLTLEVSKAADKKPVRDIKLRDRIMAERGVATLMHLATLDGAAEASVKTLRETIDKFIGDKNEIVDWRDAKYALLVALDRGDEVEAVLKECYAGEGDYSRLRWGRAYAYILAERNRIEETIRIFEEVEKLGGLGHEDYRTLADWYMVRNMNEKHRGARIKSWEELSEYQISDSIERGRHRYERSGSDVPSELDPEIPLKFIALFRKSPNPEHRIYQLRAFYEVTKDYRLLECLPEAVIGQTSQKIYPFLERLDDVTGLIQDEAVVDRLVKRLNELHGKSASPVDRRALRLLEFMVERRAADQSHGGGPHAEAALRALKEAFKEEWHTDETDLMAKYLSVQGELKPPALADEQIRQLSELYRKAGKDIWSQLTVGGHLASAQWANHRKEDAIRTLDGVLEEARRDHGGLLPQTRTTFIQTYAGYLEQVHRFAAAEKVWLGELKKDYPTTQIYWFKQQLYEHYQKAMAARAEVSLGKGEALYRAVHAQMLKELEERTNENFSGSLMSTLSAIWTHAHTELKYPGIGRDVRDFAFARLPTILNRYHYRNAQPVVGMLAETLNRVSGPRAALEFLVTRAETEPRWLRLASDDFWHRHGSSLARYRSESSALDNALEGRALAIVLRQLWRALELRNHDNPGIYDKRWGQYFWADKQGEFARVAHEVLSRQSDSEQAVLYIADYLYYGLGRHAEGIAALTAAYRKGILGIEGQYKLCVFLQEQKRYAESVPLLVKMIPALPDRVEFRTMLMKGYYYTGKLQELVRVLKEADGHFKEKKLWVESVIAALGSACLETHLFDECVAYYKEAIALRVKVPDRGIGGGALSQYYRHTAEAYSGLGKTDDAVDAASGAIISWGPRRDDRQNELDTLDKVLEKAKDLDEYVVRLDAEVKKTGMENPILRKALGKVYRKRERYDRAEVQFRLAAETRPNDMETHQAMVELYDTMGRPDRAVSYLMETSIHFGRNFALFKDLGDRWAKLEQSSESERAYTNIVEILPNESESHQALAEIRQTQNRWDDAVGAWNQVIRVRSKEPGGYLGLAKSLVHLKKWSEARVVLQKIMKTDWPSRFGDVADEAKKIEKQIEK